MKLSYRRLVYLVAGGAILTWINPSHSLLLYVLILGLILGAAYLDTILFAPRAPHTGQAKVVSLAGGKAGRGKRHGTAGRARRSLQTVYSSAFQGDVEALLRLLRAKGMNPMMVSDNPGLGKAGPVYQVRLPAREVEPAKPVITLFQMKSAKTHS